MIIGLCKNIVGIYKQTWVEAFLAYDYHILKAPCLESLFLSFCILLQAGTSAAVCGTFKRSGGPHTDPK